MWMQSTEDDPYHMTLHKLWTKMCEKDWRTVVKSLYVLHCISRDCSADACQRFATAIKYVNVPLSSYCYMCKSISTMIWLLHPHVVMSLLFTLTPSSPLISMELRFSNRLFLSWSHVSTYVILTYLSYVNRSLARTRNPKNPDHKYFAVSPVGDVDVLGRWWLHCDVLCCVVLSEEDGWYVCDATYWHLYVRCVHDLVRLFCNASIWFD